MRKHVGFCVCHFYDLLPKYSVFVPGGCLGTNINRYKIVNIDSLSHLRDVECPEGRQSTSSL